MDLEELKKKLKEQLEKGQTVENLIDYVLCDFTMMNIIITKYHGVFSNVKRNTQKRLVKEFINELM